MAKTTFSPNTKIKSAEVNANFEGAYDGSLDYDYNSLERFRLDFGYHFVVSGLVIPTSVSLASTTTAGYAVVNGKRVTTSATAKTYTASKDTYVDLNSDGTFTYTEVANNAASPALSASAMRIAIVVTSGTAVTSVNQGQAEVTVPVASSSIYSITDSLGNLIYNRTPTPEVIGYRQITADNTRTGATTDAEVVALAMPVIVPAGRKVRLRFVCNRLEQNGSGVETTMKIWDGAVGGTQVGQGEFLCSNGTGSTVQWAAQVMETRPIIASLSADSSKTYRVSQATNNAGQASVIRASATMPAFVEARLLT